MKIKLTRMHVDNHEKALRFYIDVTAAVIATVDDTCGNLLQLTQIARW